MRFIDSAESNGDRLPLSTSWLRKGRAACCVRPGCSVRQLGTTVIMSNNVNNVRSQDTSNSCYNEQTGQEVSALNRSKGEVVQTIVSRL